MSTLDCKENSPSGVQACVRDPSTPRDSNFLLPLHHLAMIQSELDISMDPYKKMGLPKIHMLRQELLNFSPLGEPVRSTH